MRIVRAASNHLRENGDEALIDDKQCFIVNELELVPLHPIPCSAPLPADTKYRPMPSSNVSFHDSVCVPPSLPRRQTDIEEDHLLTLAYRVFVFAAANAVAQQSLAGTAPVHMVGHREAHKGGERRNHRKM